MTTLSIPTVYAALRRAGFSVADAEMGTAVGLAESGLNDEAIGDVGLEDRVWGPSVGAFQERTLKAERGHGTMRDESWLLGNIDHQARAAYETWRQDNDTFRPWSTWLHGSAQARLGEVRSALARSTTVLSSGSKGTITQSTGGDEMLTVVRGTAKAEQVIKTGVWTTLDIANPQSLIGSSTALDVIMGEVALYFSDLLPTSTVQIRPYTVKVKGKAWTFEQSWGIDERPGSTGETFIKSVFQGHLYAGERLRIQADVAGQAEAHLTNATWAVSYQK